MMNKEIKYSTCCLNCAFLCKLRYSTSTELSVEDREKLKNGCDDFLKIISHNTLVDQSLLSCYKSQIPTDKAYSVWKHGKILEPIHNLNKKKCEFYFPYTECTGITLQAVEQKQIRNIEITNALTSKRTLNISKKAMWISIFSLIVTLIFSLISLFK